MATTLAIRPYPGDPRFGTSRVEPTPEEVSALGSHHMLKTRLLDVLLQRSAPVPSYPPSFACESGGRIDFLGPLSTKHSMETSVQHLKDRKDVSRGQTFIKAVSKRIDMMRSKLSNVFNLSGKQAQRLIIPIVQSAHFFVFAIDFNAREPGSNDGFISKVNIYDSLVCTAKRTMRTTRHAVTTIGDTMLSVLDLVTLVNTFLNCFVLHKPSNFKLRRTNDQVLGMLSFEPCPQQLNSIDCGLFCVGVVLHLLDNQVVDGDTFDSKAIAALRMRLYVHFTGKVIKKKTKSYAHVIHEPTSKVIRDSFRKLRRWEAAISIQSLSDTDTGAIEGPPSEDELAALVVAASEMERDEDMDGTSSVTLSSPAGATTSSRASTPGDIPPELVDTVLTSLLKDMEVGFFPCLEDINPVIDAYEAKTGFRLCVTRSVNERYRWYRCKGHIDCPFEMRIGKRRSDGLFFVRLTVNHHGPQRIAAVASDGRRWKVRRAGRLDGVIRDVLSTKKDAPTPADIIHAVKGVTLPYMSAWRALNVQTTAAREEDSTKYQLVIPYLTVLKQQNPSSIIGYSRDDDLRLSDVHVFPEFMDRALAFVRPVICLDAAHLSGSEKGTLYVASCLSGANEVYPIGFMIAKGNEDRATWTKMLLLLKECCPSLLKCNKVDVPGYGMHQHAFLFMSDRDKGLQPALMDVFPNNISMACAMHIKANVAQRFGQACSRNVINISKTYSVRYASYLMEQVRRIKPEAAEYIDSITDLWRSADWLLPPGRNSLDPTQVMPPRYGIVTSNTSESVNNMLKPARHVGWLDAIDIIINIMSTRIYKCRMQWITKPPNELVGRVQQIIQFRWEASVHSTVIELNQRDGIFIVGDNKVPVVETTVDANMVNDAAAMPVALGSRSATHTVKPAMRECTCGAWQDLLYPCRHACAVYKHHYHKTVHDMMDLVHPFYRYKSMHALYEDNVFPVCMDNLKHDGITKPPLVIVRQAGRPRTKRIRRRSEVDSSASKVQCSLCHQRGHNKRTCTSEEKRTRQD